MQRTGRPARASGDKRRPAADRRTPHALDLFEKAVKALSRKEFDRARGFLDELISKHPEEPEMVERAHAYLAVCERSREKRQTRPKTFEDLLHYGIYLHNRGEYQDALRHLNLAAEIHPRNEHVLYCLAASAARAGDVKGALRALRLAIGASPGSRAQARTDPDFEALREHAEFLALVAS